MNWYRAGWQPGQTDFTDSMAVSQSPLIAREGWLVIAVLVVIAIVVWSFTGFVWSVPLWLTAVAALMVFRDPAREVPSSPLAVVSPADGEVLAIEETHDPYLGRDSIRFSIQMFPYGVYATRSPVEGRVLETPHSNGVDSGMRKGVWLQTDEKDDVVLVMNRSRLINTAPRCYVRFGERVGQGQRCGFIHLGSRVDVYVPSGSRVNVKQGGKVYSGSSVVATLVHK